MKCLVTGGEGFIGKRLAERLRDLGNEVIIFDKKNGDDLLDFDRIDGRMFGIDRVYHLAANSDVRFGADNPRLDTEQGVLATQNVLEAMRANNVSDLIYASSSSVYGLNSQNATERTLPEPISMYGASKLACESLIRAYSYNFGFRSRIYRFANVIGDGVGHGVIVDFVKKLRDNCEVLHVLGDGTQRKSYILVDDVIDGIFISSETDEIIDTFNIGNDDSVCVDFIADLTQRCLSLKDVERVYSGGKTGWIGDIPEVWLDCSKLKRLGWKPSANSSAAVLETIENIK